MSKKVYIEREHLINLLFSEPYDVLGNTPFGGPAGGGFSREKLLGIIGRVRFIEADEEVEQDG